jgi:hypothetical protein
MAGHPLNALVEVFKEAFEGLYAVNVEGQSHEADDMYATALAESLCDLARNALVRYGKPPELMMRIKTDDGECVELRMTLDYKKEKVR